MTNVSIKIEILWGTPIETAASELCQLAARLGVQLYADYNGVELIVNPNHLPSEVVQHYEDGHEIKEKRERRWDQDKELGKGGAWERIDTTLWTAHGFISKLPESPDRSRVLDMILREIKFIDQLAL